MLLDSRGRSVGPPRSCAMSAGRVGRSAKSLEDTHGGQDGLALPDLPVTCHGGCRYRGARTGSGRPFIPHTLDRRSFSKAIQGSITGRWKDRNRPPSETGLWHRTLRSQTGIAEPAGVGIGQAGQVWKTLLHRLSDRLDVSIHDRGIGKVVHASMLAAVMAEIQRIESEYPLPVRLVYPRPGVGPFSQPGNLPVRYGGLG